MFRDQKVVVIMPAYNSARTLRRTYDEVIAQEIVDLVIVVDDASHDETVAIARTLPLTQVEIHPRNPRANVPAVWSYCPANDSYSGGGVTFFFG